MFLENLGLKSVANHSKIRGIATSVHIAIIFENVEQNCLTLYKFEIFLVFTRESGSSTD